MSHLQTSDSQDDSQYQYCNYHLPATHHCISTIKGDNSYISSLVIGGKFLYTGSSNKEIRMLKCDNLRAEFEYEKLSDCMIITGNGAVKSLVVSADKIFSAHQDHKIRVWRVDESEVSRHERSTWFHHNDTVAALAVSVGHRGPVKCLTSETDHSRSSDTSTSYLIYSGGLDSDIKVWQISIPL
ncbi:hypothetical protein L1987_51757 [Smallanthus sonchifolius]|uniref:Uncharacterized protein n=1 Tax=Smallanthus sonchifolius TaxID=185202 RepID=A0ACB9ER82_9ASTR|nr:hypothetical protein L1987_51757 [Smallanthus sonchifolius]